MSRFNIPRQRRYPMRPRVLDMRQHTRFVKIPEFVTFAPWGFRDAMAEMREKVKSEDRKASE